MKKELQQLIAQGRPDQALQKLLTFSEQYEDKDFREEILFLSARYEEYAKSKRQGTSSAEEQQISIARINQAVVHLISQLPGDLATKPGLDIPRIFPKLTNKPWWQWVVGASMFITILAGIAEFTGYNFRSLFGFKTLGGPLQLTVYIHGPKGPQDIVLEKKGKLIADLGNRRDTRQIGEYGRTNFGEIDHRFLGKAIGLFMEAEGYEVSYPDSTYFYSGEPIYLAVKPDNQLGIIKGIVKSQDGKSFVAGAQVFINADTSVFTDVNGIFKILLPEAMRVKSPSESYKLIISKDGFETVSQYFFPNTYAEIPLQKQ